MKRRSSHQERSFLQRGALIVLALIIVCACSPGVLAQWTQPDGNGNINSTNTNNVGIGTTTPGAKLTVSNNTQSSPAGQPGTAAHIVGGNGASVRLLVDAFGAVYPSIDMRRANNTASSPSAVLNNEGIGQITWQGYGATSYNPASRAKITAFAAENFTDTAQGTFMTFAVAPVGGLTALEAMRIAASGFVGLGTTAPAYRLDVQSGQINSSGGLCIAGDCKTAWSQVGGSQWTTSGSTINYSAGNVGIGTSGAPTRKLEVLGGNVFHQWSATPGAEHGFYTALANNHFTSNLYFDGSWKMIGSGKGSLISVAPAISQAFTVYGENTSRSANSAASTLTQLFTITTTGGTGIGTATPGYKLDVQGGQINSSGGLCIAGDCKSAWNQVGSQWTTSGSTINYSSGNVGIGVASPTSKLHVAGTVEATGLSVNGTPVVSSQWSTSGTTVNYATGNVGIATASPTEKLHVTGNVKVTGNIDVGGNINAKYQDMAEWVDSPQALSPATVVVLDLAKSNQVIASTQSYDSRVAGVISLKPGVALGEAGEGRVLVATTGRVKVKVDATNGPINIGDLLVTSDKEGVAMKSIPVEIGGVRIHRPGTLIGKALEPLAQGTGEILVLLSLQ